MPRKRDPNKPKKTFWDRYKHYDPQKEGFGSPQEWQEKFKQRINSGASAPRSKRSSPKNPKIKIPVTARDILGVSADATWPEIRHAYRHLVLEKHPDRGGSQEEFIEVQEAYELVKKEFET